MASGLSFVHGCARIVAFRKKTCPDAWAYSSSSTLFAAVAGRCSIRFVLPWQLFKIKEPGLAQPFCDRNSGGINFSAL